MGARTDPETQRSSIACSSSASSTSAWSRSVGSPDAVMSHDDGRQQPFSRTLSELDQILGSSEGAEDRLLRALPHVAGRARRNGPAGGRKRVLAVKKERGIHFYQESGRLGGERVGALIAAGRKATLQRRRVCRQHR